MKRMKRMRRMRGQRWNNQVMCCLLHDCIHRLFCRRKGRYMRWMGATFFCQSLRNDLFCADSRMFGGIMYKFDGLTSLFLCCFRRAYRQFMSKTTCLRHHLTHMLHRRERKTANVLSVLFGQCTFEKMLHPFT